MGEILLNSETLEMIMERTVDYLESEMIKNDEKSFVILFGKEKMFEFLKSEIRKELFELDETLNEKTIEKSIEINVNKLASDKI